MTLVRHWLHVQVVGYTLNSLQVKDLQAKMQSLAIYFSWNWINI